MSRSYEVLNHVDEHLDQALDRLFQLLRLESVSTDPAYQQQCRQAAEWLRDDLAGIGFDAEVCPTPGHPMVVAKHAVDSDQRRLLFYGHYDVQPVDPLPLWNTPPFEPAIQDTDSGKVIRGRGTADDKGQLMTFVEACRAWKSVHGCLPGPITVFFEGEEESGSPSLVPFIEANRERLAADLALVCDTGMWDADTPGITTMLRGMIGEQITLTGPSIDLHSGLFGGPAMNPIRVLTRLIAGLHDDEGRVTLPGFYDGVSDIPVQLREQWQALGHDDSAFLTNVGLSKPAGESGYSVLEQIWARPTCEVNGISGGYTGEGFKTVLPSQATAKISFRLVGQQDPDKIRQTFRHYVESGLPEDFSVSYKSKDGSPATVMPIDNEAFALARTALSDEWPNEAAFIGSGGSIPVVGHFQRILGIDSLLIGFGLKDDAMHSPNEKYQLTSFHKGIRSWVRVLDKLTN